MVRNRAWIIGISLVIALTLAACAPLQGGPDGLSPTSPAAPDTSSVDGIAAQLEAQGLNVDVIGAGAGPALFDLTPTQLSVNGETVEIYQFVDEASAQTAAAGIGDILSRSRWAAPPHFFQQGKVIAFYLGATQEIVTSLTALYGPEVVAVVSEPATDSGGAAEDVTRVNIYMVALEDNGAQGDMIGCQDSIVGVPRDIPATASPMEAALTELFAQKDMNYGESGFYNSLYQSNLAVESVVLEEGLATVYLTGEFLIGGACDNPRFKAQIEYTVLQFSEVQAVEIFLNGEPIDQLLDGQG